VTVIFFVYCSCSCLLTSVAVGDDSPAAADDVAKVNFLQDGRLKWFLCVKALIVLFVTL